MLLIKKTFAAKIELLTNTFFLCVKGGAVFLMTVKKGQRGVEHGERNR